MQIEAVVFDIGNVLIAWQPERFYDARIGVDRRRALFAAVDLPGMNDRIDLGEDFAGTVYDTARTHPDWQEEIRLWHDSWIELAKPEIPRSVRILRALRAKRVPVFSLSNIGAQSFELAATHYPFLRDFDRHYLSGHLNKAKPDPAIYEALESDCGIAPGRLLFTDDRPDNIAAAVARGWQTHLFQDPDGWADRLIRAGLLTPQGAA